MLEIGLTGNVASGKSEVCEMFRDWGATVIDTDQLAREVVVPGSPALERIREIWGETVLTPSGELDRARMRRHVFRDPEARRRLESILHPAIMERYAELVREAGARGDRIVVAAVPLLYEADLEDRFDLVVLVDAPVDERIRRLVELRGLDEDEARRIVEAQMPAREKRRRAHLVIDNDSDIPTLERRAWETWKEIERMAAG